MQLYRVDCENVGRQKTKAIALVLQLPTGAHCRVQATHAYDLASAESASQGGFAEYSLRGQDWAIC